MSALSEIRGQRSATGGQMTDGIAQRTETNDQRSAVRDRTSESVVRRPSSVFILSAPTVALLTGGNDRPYVLGLVETLTSANMFVDVVGSDELRLKELLQNPRVNFLNLR